MLNHAEVTGLRFTKGRVTGAELRGPLDGDRVRRQRPARAQRHRPLGRPPAQDGGPERGAVHPAVQGRAPGPQAHRPRGRPRWRPRSTSTASPSPSPGRTCCCSARPTRSTRATRRTSRSPRRTSAQILDEAAFSIRDQQLSRDLITYSFAGLRVLPGGPGDTAKAKRETVVTEGRGGMLSVAGGKWTTFRHIGRTVMKKLAALPGRPLGDDLEPIASLPKKLPLPGVANPRAVAHRLLVDGPAPRARAWPPTRRSHLATHYGSLSFDIARLANERPGAGRADPPGRPGDLGAGRLRAGQRVGRDGGRRAAPPDDADDPGSGDGRGPRARSRICSTRSRRTA